MLSSLLMNSLDQNQPPSSSPEVKVTASMENKRMPNQALNCPRCDSPNTKFCYFNNYSLTQPRHFCKSCRRYWTRGGVRRKNKKLSSTSERPTTRSTTNHRRLQIPDGTSPTLNSVQLSPAHVSAHPDFMESSGWGGGPLSETMAGADTGNTQGQSSFAEMEVDVKTTTNGLSFWSS